MHPLQRRSLFAILTIAESAIQQMKSILAQEPDAEGVPKAARPPQPSIGEKEYLTESEEEAFERLLEVFVDVIAERFERRDIKDPGLVGQIALQPFPE